LALCGSGFQDLESRPKLTNKSDFQPFKKAFTGTSDQEQQQKAVQIFNVVLRIFAWIWCCGTGTARTVTFCLNETALECIPVLELVLDPLSNLKWNTKIKWRRQTFWEIMLLITLERQD
jgi:hypothetical protein